MFLLCTCFVGCTSVNIIKNKYDIIYTTNKIRSIVQASKSILNDKMMKVWMFVMFGLQLFAFLLEPIARPGTFRLYLYSMWNCQPYPYADGTAIHCDESSNAMFVIHTLMLRMAVPLLLIHSVFTFAPKSSHFAQIMHYKYFYEVFSPSGIAIVAILMFIANYFIILEYETVTWTYVGFVLVLGLWQIYLFKRLLSLGERVPFANFFNYLSKGIAYLFLWAIEYICLYTFASVSSNSSLDYDDTDVDNMTRMDMVYRLIPAMIFAVMSMFMLVPLQKIATNPTYAELRDIYYLLLTINYFQNMDNNDI